jgi:hypothetical protein
VFEVSTDFLLGVTDNESTLKPHRDEIKELKRNIMQYEARLEFMSENTFREIQDDYKYQINQMLAETKESLNNKLTLYILEYMELPFFNPNNDEIMKNVFPIEIRVISDLFSYHIELVDKNGKRVNILKSYDFNELKLIKEQAKLKAEMLKEELDLILSKNISKYYVPEVVKDSFFI